MLQLFKRVGGVLRGLYLLGFGALWAFAAFASNAGGADQVTVVGIGALALLAGSAGFIITVKALLVPTRSKESKWVGEETPVAADPHADPEDELDADAAIQRYLAGRERAEPPPPARPVAPARPGFGRKGVLQ